jgi:AcrR family transcriptional regulator
MDMTPAKTATNTLSPAAPPGEVKQRADARRNREKVLAAARRQFAEHGLDVHMERIARDAEVGIGTVYRRFPTKEDLLQALADDRFEGLADAARSALKNPDPWEGFCEFMRYSGQVMAEDRALSEAMDQRADACGGAAERAGLPELVAELVSRAQAAGQMRGDVGADDIPGLVCGLGRTIRGGTGPTMSWERYLDIMLAGLRAAP